MACPHANTQLTRIDAAASKTTPIRPDNLTGLQLYSRYAFAGAICCSVTHGILTPVDVSVSTSYTSLLSLLTCDVSIGSRPESSLTLLLIIVV